jgi:hypothetical protein
MNAWVLNWNDCVDSSACRQHSDRRDGFEVSMKEFDNLSTLPAPPLCTSTSVQRNQSPIFFRTAKASAH